MLIKHGRYSMKDDIVGLPYEFEALRPRGVSDKCHDLSSRSEFIDSDILQDEYICPTPEHSQV